MPRVFLIASLIFGLVVSKVSGQNRPSHSLPTLPVVVNGRNGRFLVDTGAEHSIIDKSFANELSLKANGTVNVQQPYSGAQLNAVTAERFSLGERKYSHVSFLELDLRAMSTTQNVALDGILGTDFLKSTYMVLSYSSGEAQLVSSLDDSGAPLRLSNAGKVFFVPVLIGQSELELLLDSGTNSTAINAATWHALSILQNSSELLEGIRSAGTSVTFALWCAPTFRFGGITLIKQVVRVVPLTPAGSFSNEHFSGLLGADILAHFQVTLDLAHSTIYLRPNLAYRLDPNAFVTIGIQFFMTETKSFEVAAVWRHSPAEEAGILVGDQIVSVNGNRSAKLDLEGFANQLHAAAGSPITLEIKRSGRDLVVHTVTRRLACESGQRPLR